MQRQSVCIQCSPAMGTTLTGCLKTSCRPSPGSDCTHLQPANPPRQQIAHICNLQMPKQPHPEHHLPELQICPKCKKRAFCNPGEVAQYLRLQHNKASHGEAPKTQNAQLAGLSCVVCNVSCVRCRISSNICVCNYARTLFPSSRYNTLYQPLTTAQIQIVFASCSGSLVLHTYLVAHWVSHFA